jgi:repressor of nif and glnA expression
LATDVDRKTTAILRLIADAKEPIGSKELSQKLVAHGVNLTERAVRYHLKLMEEQGLLKGIWKEGRLITEKGAEEINNAQVADRVGFINSRIENLAYRMDFDLTWMKGKVILNISFIDKADFSKALEIMAPIYKNNLTMGQRVAVAEHGDELGGVEVPEGKVAFGTLCSINLNGILLKHGIPVESKFGGVLQMKDRLPFRFTELIHYSASTLDPHEIFLKSRMTSVNEAASGEGKILAGFREIPAICRQDAEKLLKRIDDTGLGNILLLGNPGQTVLGMPVGIDRVGVVVPGGLNPIAALEENGIETESKALSALIDYGSLKKFSEL